MSQPTWSMALYQRPSPMCPRLLPKVWLVPELRPVTVKILVKISRLGMRTSSGPATFSQAQPRAKAFCAIAEKACSFGKDAVHEMNH